MSEPIVNEYGVPVQFMWNGEPIADVFEWARSRGEQMVRYRKTWREPNVFAGEIIERELVSVMPAVFFDSLRFGGPYDEQFEAFERFDP